MVPDRAPLIDTENRVVRFRLRPGMSRGCRRELPPNWNSAPDNSPVENLERYERAGNDDDYRHRMIMNAIVTAFVASMVVAGVWIASVIAQVR
jgi:hypothetical protein